jgi:hypothetical protein
MSILALYLLFLGCLTPHTLWMDGTSIGTLFKFKCANKDCKTEWKPERYVTALTGAFRILSEVLLVSGSKKKIIGHITIAFFG